ncbi:MAG: MFS transporter, partial [Bacillota bacterium]|nr:MFS transporter [Bacillota bacterium]
MDKSKIKVAILAISSVLMAAMTASAILADISIYYSEVEQSVIQMVLTLPALLAMVFALISGPLSTKFSKRNIVIFGLLSAFFGGALAFIFGGISIYALLIASVLIGVGQGINSTMSMALIADYFIGEERSTLMGLQSAFVNFGGMVIVLISGVLAGFDWKLSYLVYFVFLPVLFLVIRGLPNQAPLKQTVSSTKEESKLNKVVYYTCFVVFCFAALLFVLQTNISLVIANNNLGNATSGGLANSFMVAIGAITGFSYGHLKRLLKQYIIPVGISATAFGMFLIFAVGNLASIFVAAACAGFGLSSIMPTAIFNVSSSVKPEVSATAIALTTSAANVGMFFSPFIINGV